MASSPVAALRNARLPPLSPPRVAGGARPAPAAPPRTPPPASVLSLPIFSPPKWAFLVSYANMRLTVPTLLAWLACITFHYACTLRILEFAAAVDPASVHRPPLRDTLHELLPNLQTWRAAPEAGHLVSVLHLAAQMLWHFDQRSLDAIRTFLWVHGPLVVMRGLCFSSTLLPDASQQCTTSRYLGSCHDLIFSGHVLIMALSIGIGRLFFPDTPPAHARAVWAASALTTLLIAAARNHYTVDILLALLLTPLTLHFCTTHPGALALAVTDPSVYPWAPRSRAGLAAKAWSYSSSSASSAPLEDDSASVGSSATPLERRG